MPISLITENYWADIVKIQKEAYTDIAPEDVNILKINCTHHLKPVRYI